MIMGIESSSMTITAGAFKTKILQDVKDAKIGKNSDHQTAFLAKKNKKIINSRCYNCNNIVVISRINVRIKKRKVTIRRTKTTGTIRQARQ